MTTERPSGTVTFLFTDIEGSTRLWEERPDEMRAALAEHDILLRDSIEAHGGYVFATGGDGFAAAFHRAGDAVDAASRAQAKLGAAGACPLLNVRMAVHSGEAQERDGDYFGPAVNRAARLMAAGHGGQVLVSLAAEELLGGRQREALVDLGERRLRDLSLPERVYQVGRAAFPALKTVDATPGNLPLQVTSFVGRERDVAELADVVRRERLVTLTGAGGVGKTRLALQVAAELAPEIAGGAWLVELGPLADPEVVGQVILATLGVRQREAMTVTESVVEYLSARGALLVIDNCEHLLDAAAAVVEPIMRACATTRILATSREGLGVPGERLVAVRTLPTPSIGTPLADLPQSAAVELFVDRARAADAGFELTERNAAAVAQLCRRLDGVPFAIELAAARVSALSPDDIVARLDQRFRLLSGASRATLERHQTLRRTVDWSYDLLNVRDKTVFNRLSIFAGSFDIAAAEAVAVDGDRSGGGTDERPGHGIAGLLEPIDVVEAVVSLVAKSVLTADTVPTGRRYRMMETLRQYGRERLAETGESADLRERHARHFLAFAGTADLGLRSRDEALWHQRIVAGIDDLRQVFELAADTADTDRAMRLCAALEFFTWTRHTYGVHLWCRQALDLPGADEHPEAARVCGLAAIGLIMTVSELGSIRELARRGIAAELGGTARPSHTPWTALGSVALLTGDVPAGIEAWRTALERALGSSDAGIVAQIEANLVFGLSLIEDGADEAETLGARALTRARSAGAPSIIAWASAWLGLVTSERDHVPTVMLGRDLAVIVRETGSDYLPGAMGAVVRVPYRMGRTQEALTGLVEYFDYIRRLGNLWSSWLHLPIVGLIAADLDRLEVACACFASVPDEFTGYPELSDPVACARSRIAAELDPAIAARAEARAAAMTVTELADLGAGASRELLGLIDAGRADNTRDMEHVKEDR